MRQTDGQVREPARDPVRDRVSWLRNQHAGTTVALHRLVFGRETVQLGRSGIIVVLLLIPLAFGVFLLKDPLTRLLHADVAGFFAGLFAPAVALGLAWAFHLASRGYSFDLRNGSYRHGVSVAGGRIGQKQGRIADIHALQLIPDEYVYWMDERNASTVRRKPNIELNLVMHDATRRTLTVYVDEAAAERDAARMAGMLGVPLWHAIRDEDREASVEQEAYASRMAAGAVAGPASVSDALDGSIRATTPVGDATVGQVPRADGPLPDVVASTVDWEPLDSISPWMTRTLQPVQIEGSIIQLRRHWGLWLGILLLAGFAFPTGLISLFMLMGGQKNGVMIALATILMLLPAIWLYRNTREYTIDNEIHRHYRGRHASGVRTWPRNSRVEDIHALQIVPTTRAQIAGRPLHLPYPTYELNLVFKDASRLAVLNNIDKFHVAETTSVLARVLQVPVWRARLGTDTWRSLDEALPVDPSLW